jgi:hypothetical protein
MDNKSLPSSVVPLNGRGACNGRMGANGGYFGCHSGEVPARDLRTGTGLQEAREFRTIETATDAPIAIPFEKKNILESTSVRPTERSDQAAAFFGSVIHTERSHATQSDKK